MKVHRNVIAAILLAGSLSAQQSSSPKPPAELPPAGVVKPPVLAAVGEHQLKNGMSVWLVNRPGLPKVAFRLVVRGGDSFDPADAPGLAKLMAKTVTQGTSTRSSREVAEAAQGTGGDLAATATIDSTQVTLDTLSEKAANGVSLIADVAQNASFPASEVELAKSNMEDALRASEAGSNFLAQRAWYRVLYGENPYHIVSASMKTLESAQPSALQNLYRQEFRPDQALLVVVGSFDAASLMPQIEKAFAGWKAPTTAQPSVQKPESKIDHSIYYIERPTSVQTTMLIGALGMTARDPDRLLLRVADTIYGGSFSSRLTRNIREDKGYTYSPYSYTLANRLSGVCITREDVRNEVTGPSLKETFFELKRISTEPPSAQEMDQAQRYLIGNTALDLQSRTELTALLGRYWVNGQPSNYLTTEMAQIQKATATQVAQTAAKYLAPDRMTVIAVGEKAIILEQLKPFGMEIKPVPAE